MRPKSASVGLVNSKKAAVHGIIGKASVITKAAAEMDTTSGAGQPAFSIGNIDRIDAISRSSVITLAMNQLVCSTSGEMR